MIEQSQKQEEFDSLTKDAFYSGSGKKEDDGVLYLDRQRKQDQREREKIDLAADKLFQQLSQTRGQEPIKEAGRFHTSNISGSEVDPLADWEQLTDQQKQTYLYNRHILREIIDIFQRKQAGSDLKDLYPLEKYLYSLDLDKIAKSSGLDDTTMRDDRHRNGRHTLYHRRYDAIHIPIRLDREAHISGGTVGADTYLPTWATVVEERVFQEKSRYALGIVDLSPLVSFMRQPRTPVEIADALYELLEESALEVKVAQDSRPSNGSLRERILQKLGGK